ncbi:hypothetical protein VF21_09780 [Pseudogymnoascus sp. 05NY08]|nr:hypothetical protein VF21_09780 [Pseudogymnoascus sp. 05NY08]
MAEKLKDTAIYKAYLALGTRPQNSPTFSRDAKGNIILVSGEVYYRAAMPNGSICKVNKLLKRQEKVHRPILLQKKDGSIHKGNVKKISRIIANRCEECCLDLNNFKCEVRNYFTNGLDEELKEGEVDEQDQDLESK